MKNGAIECSVCHSKLVSPSTKGIARAYDRHKIRVSSKQRALNTLLVVGDCILVGLQVIFISEPITWYLIYFLMTLSFFLIEFSVSCKRLWLHDYSALFYYFLFWCLCFSFFPFLKWFWAINCCSVHLLSNKSFLKWLLFCPSYYRLTYCLFLKLNWSFKKP